MTAASVKIFVTSNIGEYYNSGTINSLEMHEALWCWHCQQIVDSHHHIRIIVHDMKWTDRRIWWLTTRTTDWLVRWRMSLLGSSLGYAVRRITQSSFIPSVQLSTATFIDDWERRLSLYCMTYAVNAVRNNITISVKDNWLEKIAIVDWDSRLSLVVY